MNSDFINDINEVRNELKEIEKEINSERHKLSKISKHLTYYSVVRASGRIEILFKKILSARLKSDCGTSHNRIKDFILKEIMESSSNPKITIIENYLSKFDSNWKDSFSDKLKKHEHNIKSDLNSLVQLRNDVAHGNNCTATIDTIIKYYESGVLVLDILDNVLSSEDSLIPIISSSSDITFCN